MNMEPQCFEKMLVSYGNGHFITLEFLHSMLVEKAIYLRTERRTAKHYISIKYFWLVAPK